MERPKRRILLVEDEAPIVEVLAAYLQRDGFSTHHIGDGDAAIAWLAGNSADLILLDLMLPGLDGLEISKRVRQVGATPIIIISARVEEIDRLIGLELGADDYVCKPFSPREVVARVKAVLRRAQASAAGKAEDIQIDTDTFTVRILGEPLELTPTEFKLFAALGRKRGRVLSRAQLLDAAGGKEEVFDRAIDSHIKNLRRKISHILPDQEVIQSIYGVGYRLEMGLLGSATEPVVPEKRVQA